MGLEKGFTGMWAVVGLPVEIQRFPHKGFLEFGLKTRGLGGILIEIKHFLRLFI